MKILMLSFELQKPCGGVGNYVYNLCENIDKDHEIFLVAPGRREFKNPNVNLFPMPLSNNLGSTWIMYYSMAWYRALKLIKREDIDLVHSHQGCGFFIPNNVPHINTAHGDMEVGYRIIKNLPHEKVQGLDGLIKSFGKIGMRVERREYRRSERVIAVSEMVKDRLKRHMPSEKINVIKNGVDKEKYRSRDSDLAKRYGAENLVLYVGRLSATKNVKRIIRNAGMIGDEKTKILIAGKGGQKSKLVKMRNKRKLKDKVKFLGFVDPVEYYSAADVFILPSIMEAFGMVVLESMACETPVVASKSGGPEEIIEHGEDGFLFDGDGEMVRYVNGLLEDEDRRRGMGQRSREKVVQNFSWEGAAEETEEVYRKVLESS